MHYNSHTSKPIAPALESGLIRFSEMPRHIPAGKNGKKRHVSTIYRYAFRGVGGVKLEAWRLPDGWYSTFDAWARFVERLTDAGQRSPHKQLVPPARTAKRHQHIENEIDEVRASIGRKTTSSKEKSATTATTSDPKPRWDADRAELWLGKQLCKRFRQPAKNQRLVLDAFKRQNWPSRIDDPLPRDPDTDVRQRLADTVRRLNDKNTFILFELDGFSSGILWAPK